MVGTSNLFLVKLTFALYFNIFYNNTVYFTAFHQNR